MTTTEPDEPVPDSSGEGYRHGLLPVWLLHDALGSGHIWQVWVGRTMIWSHASIEGPASDALDLWDALAKYVPTSEATDG